MGYRSTYAVIAVDTKEYTKKELMPWTKEWDFGITEMIVDEDASKVVFVLDWSKQTYKAVNDFIDNYAHKGEGEDGIPFVQFEGMGVIQLGESDNDVVEYWGEPWEFDVNLERSISY